MIKFLATMFKGSQASKIGLSDQIKHDLQGLYQSNPGLTAPGAHLLSTTEQKAKSNQVTASS